MAQSFIESLPRGVGLNRKELLRRISRRAIGTTIEAAAGRKFLVSERFRLRAVPTSLLAAPLLHHSPRPYLDLMRSQVEKYLGIPIVVDINKWGVGANKVHVPQFIIVFGQTRFERDLKLVGSMQAFVGDKAMEVIDEQVKIEGERF